MMHQVPIKEFYQTAKDTLKSHGISMYPWPFGKTL